MVSDTNLDDVHNLEIKFGFVYTLPYSSFPLTPKQMYSIMKDMAHGIKTGKTTGFASPSQGYEETNIDLNEILIKNPSSTYLFKLDSEDISNLELSKGSVLVVDRSRTPVSNQLVIIRHEGHFLCRLMVKNKGKTIFTNGIDEIEPIPEETEIIGVVTASFKEYP